MAHSCEYLGPVSGSIDSNSRGGTYVGEYLVIVDPALLLKPDILAALILGQGNGPDPLPAYGDPYHYEAGDTVADDAGSLATNFSGTPSPDRQKWNIEVTWRARDAGEFKEDLTTGDALLRPARFWVDSENTAGPIVAAYNRQALRTGVGGSWPRPVNTFGPIETASAEIQHIERDGEIRHTINIRKNVANWEEIVTRNNTYQDTTNNATWTVGSLSIAAGKARFLVARGSQPMYDKLGRVYYQMITQVEITKSDFAIRVPNAGYHSILQNQRTFKWEQKVILDMQGMPVQQPVPLRYTGQVVTQDQSYTDQVVEYDYLTAVDYAPLSS
jgi:hypothetical protein